ncbi:MAG: twin-arginine translocase TatA/TatE family subunit [Candidatus Omnitrophota bacterium]|jgi:TatA/E family protein of Tat protein translocase|nr:MAG: twin-arginine translocase TatA/TatE family subunit [Candidatus Omnitrophota bacterium]
MGVLGTTEIIVILAVTLIVFGPHRLPEVAKYIAKAMKMFRDASRELSRQLEMADWELEQQARAEAAKKKKSTTGSASTASSSTTESHDETDDGYSENHAAADSAENQNYGGYDYESGYGSEPDAQQTNTKAPVISETTVIDPQDIIADSAKTYDAERFHRELQD